MDTVEIEHTAQLPESLRTIVELTDWSTMVTNHAATSQMTANQIYLQSNNMNTDALEPLEIFDTTQELALINLIQEHKGLLYRFDDAFLKRHFHLEPRQRLEALLNNPHRHAILKQLADFYERLPTQYTIKKET